MADLTEYGKLFEKLKGGNSKWQLNQQINLRL